jgi:hypothetical protein
MNDARTPSRPNATVLDEFSVGASEEAFVRHLETGMGERIEFVTDENERLEADALALESLAWQDDESLSELFETEYIAPVIENRDVDGRAITITNEYAHAEVRRLQTEETDCVEINAPKKRTRLLLDAEGLAALARQDQYVFSEFLKTPHGPDDHH